MPSRNPCPHDSGTYIHTVGNVEITKCSKCNEEISRMNVGEEP